MTTVESVSTRTIESVLEYVGRAVDMLELERAWCEGLRCHRDRSDRDRILQEAGTRLDVFDGATIEPLRLSWLRQVAEEVQLRGGQPLSEPLAVLVTAQLREAFSLVVDDLAALRSEVADGHDLQRYVERSPASAAKIRDLGRVVEKLSGSGTLALVARDDWELCVGFARSSVPRQPLVALVPEPMRVSRDDLLAWPEADRELPRLVRHLIAETEPSAEWLDMPAGSGVGRPGVDGILKCRLGNRFVPAGLSVWELSAQKQNCTSKARRDYDKRVEQLPRADRSDATYVALMNARWDKKREFSQERQQGSDFRSVEALDVDDLENWLECAPLTTVWLRELKGDPVTGIDLLSGWWGKWLDATTTPLDAGVVLAGRDAQATVLRERCRQNRGGVITVGGMVHRTELLAFIAAVLTQSEHSDAPFADALYVHETDQAQRLLAAEALTTSGHPSRHAVSMTVVVQSADFAQYLPAGSQHRMIVPVPGSTQTDIVLGSVDSKTVATFLQGAGLELHKAQQLGGLARISLLELRRCLAKQPSLHRPAWSTGTVEASLRRSLLLGGWTENESHEGDRQIVEQFVGRSYEAVTEALSSLDTGDSPMIPTGELWHVVSPEDIWMLLRNQFSPDDLKFFGEVARLILTEPDPMWGLKGEDLTSAQIGGVRAKYSPQLKQGVAGTLALLGTHPPLLRGDISPTSATAQRVVWQVLRSANDDATAKTWAAVSEVLPLLAEAAPDTVLEGLHTCLCEQHPFAQAMFADQDSGYSLFQPPSPHLKILAALEVLAWSPDHLIGAVELLAALADIDPGGQYANRPSSSLASIMCPWNPHTSAESEDRLKAVRMLQRSYGGAAWALLLSMLPSSSNCHISGHLPQYRNWNNPENAVSRSEYAQMVDAVVEMLLDDVGDDASRWVDLIKHTGELSEKARGRVVKDLERVANTQPGEIFRSVVWPQLRAFIADHRHYKDAKWALPESELVSFEQILDRLRPCDPVVSYGDLFSSSPTHVDGVSIADGWETLQETVSAKQTEAVSEILGDAGVRAVLELSESVESPRSVGSALARCDSTLDSEILQAMKADPKTVTQAALGYFACRFEEFGWDGIDRLVADHDPPSKVVAGLHLAAPPIEKPWKRVGALGPEVAADYWACVNYYDIGVPEELSDLLEVSHCLREAERFDLAKMLLALSTRRHGTDQAFAEEVITLLEQWIQHPPDRPNHSAMTRHELTELLETINRHSTHLDTVRMAAIEWHYCAIMSHSSKFSAPNLYNQLAKNPEFFAKLVANAFKPASSVPGDSPPMSESQSLIAQQAFRVLHAWPASTFAPDIADEGGVEAGSLNEWVDSARRHLSEIDRVKIGDTMIGTALASSPPDPDGEWPGVAVRDLIERLKSNDIDDGLFVAVRNQHGVSSRSLTDGGDQERELAERCRAKSRHWQEWPRTSAIFKSLACSYDHEAGLHDREAETHRRGLSR